MKQGKFIGILSIVFSILLIFQYEVLVTTAFNDINSHKEAVIEEFIKSNMKESKIPGLSVVIVKGDETIYQKGFGFSNIEEKKPVTADTLFELGSTSKAFTALAVFEFEERELLNLEDSVTKYLPWFKVYYEGKAIDIKLKHFLHHTSGVPFNTIGDIPIDDSNEALEKTVRTLVNKDLDFKPGEKYLYATINYDVLGLVIEKVSGQSFEKYVKYNILNKLGLNNTYLSRHNIPLEDMAKGYKLCLLKPREYQAPVYRGNTPAGYFISNTKDMAKWLKIQLDMDNEIKLDKRLIEKSHEADRSVPPGGEGSSYAGGWTVHQKGTGEISHGGNNPNFSSFIVFRPQDKIGVAVLANLNSENTYTIGQGIVDIIGDKKLPKPKKDMYKSLDNVSSSIVFMTVPIIILILYFFSRYLMDIFTKKNGVQRNNRRNIISIMAAIVFMTAFTYCLYSIPDILYEGLNWSFVDVWAPQSLIYAVISIFILALVFSLYFIMTILFPKQDDKSLFTLIILSVASGLGNAVIIFTVNETLNRDHGFQSGLFLYFAIAIVIYVYGQKLVRTRLINIANHIVYEKRMVLINKILHTSYQKIEEIEYGKIQAALNNDTEIISRFANIIITGATSFVTLLCCFVYMGIINFYGLIVALLVILFAASLYYFIGKHANRFWEQTRDIQNEFFKFINDLIGGFKELSLHSGKLNDFKVDMENSCNAYKDKRIQGDIKFANVNIIGELLFTFVIGAVAFVFPIMFKDLHFNSLRTYVFILLYMTGPVHGILGAIPEIYKVRISWRRINEMADKLDSMENPKSIQVTNSDGLKDLSIQLEEVEYRYVKNNGKGFSIGPINEVFKAGEITFITGGNGSGKSTLAKLITGLYTPDNGKISINGKKVDSLELRQSFSAIFSDFHLFEKLYGIDHGLRGNEIQRYLEILGMNDKVHIDNGVFSSIKFSTGQRKRLALLISYLEDRSVYLFDEWAADQDPEFRKFFYNELLPQLSSRGKCIIAITHDDSYFDIADRVIKMEMGKIISKSIIDKGLKN
jgi:cyclic peptide transporter